MVSQGIVVRGLDQIVSPSLQWILYGPALIDVNKGTSVRDITKRRLLITATPLQHKGYWSGVVIFLGIRAQYILGDPGAVSRFQVRAEEPLGTLSYKTSSKRSQSFWHLIGARKSLCFSAQSE